MSKRTRRKPLLCRLNMHHKWVQRSTADSAGYFQCTACGKDRYDFEFEDHDPSILGGGGGGMVAGG